MLISVCFDITAPSLTCVHRRDDDHSTDFALVRTATASNAIERLRRLTSEPFSPLSPSEP